VKPVEKLRWQLCEAGRKYQIGSYLGKFFRTVQSLSRITHHANPHETIVIITHTLYFFAGCLCRCGNCRIHFNPYGRCHLRRGRRDVSDAGRAAVGAAQRREHDLFAEPELTLLQEPDAAAAPGPIAHTGIPTTVLEIWHGGPQNLQRFYRVETVSSDTGWISDYYVRRVAVKQLSEGDWWLPRL
jgi:hypothetical protein